jgi:hypothetical protein
MGSDLPTSPNVMSSRSANESSASLAYPSPDGPVLTDGSSDRDQIVSGTVHCRIQQLQLLTEGGPDSSLATPIIEHDRGGEQFGWGHRVEDPSLFLQPASHRRIIEPGYGVTAIIWGGLRPAVSTVQLQQDPDAYGIRPFSASSRLRTTQGRNAAALPGPGRSIHTTPSLRRASSFRYPTPATSERPLSLSPSRQRDEVREMFERRGILIPPG